MSFVLSLVNHRVSLHCVSDFSISSSMIHIVSELTGDEQKLFSRWVGVNMKCGFQDEDLLKIKKKKEKTK